MTADEIVALARSDYLDDSESPQGWSDPTLERYLNQAQISADIRANLIRDKITPTDAANNPLCQLSVVAETADYVVSKKIIRIEDGKAYLLSGPDNTLLVKSEDWLNEFYPEWRTATGTPLYIIHRKGLVTLVPEPTEADTLVMPVIRLPLADMKLGGISLTGVSDISFDATTKVITTVGGNFLSEGFQVGQEITVSGTASNDGTVTPSAITRKTMTVYETLVDESDTSAVMEADSIPEISEEYHFDLIHWICHLAYSKQDAETYDAGKRDWHDKKFTNAFGPMLSASTQENRRNLHSQRQMRDKTFGG